MEVRNVRPVKRGWVICPHCRGQNDDLKIQCGFCGKFLKGGKRIGPNNHEDKPTHEGMNI